MKATTLPELVATRTPIDIYYATVGNFESALKTYDLQVDMTELIKKHGIDTSRFEPTLLTAMRGNTGGPLFGLPKALPPLRGRVDVVFGDAFEAGDGSGRRTRTALDEATVRIQGRLTAHLENARRLTGR